MWLFCCKQHGKASKSSKEHTTESVASSKPVSIAESGVDLNSVQSPLTYNSIVDDLHGGSMRNIIAVSCCCCCCCGYVVVVVVVVKMVFLLSEAMASSRELVNMVNTVYKMTEKMKTRK